MSSLSSECFVALLAHAVFSSVLIDLVTYTGRLLAFRADDLDLAGVDRALCFDYSRRIAGLACLDMLLDHVESLNDDLALLGAYLHDLAGLASVVLITGEDDNGITGLNVHLTHVRVPPLKNFRSERKDLHVILFTELTGDRPKDTSASGGLVFSDNYRGIFIKTDIRTVIAAKTSARTYNDGLDYIAFFDGAARSCFLNGSNNDVANIGIPPAGAAKYTDTHKFLCTGIVGNLEVSLLLYHSLFLL